MTQMPVDKSVALVDSNYERAVAVFGGNGLSMAAGIYELEIPVWDTTNGSLISIIKTPKAGSHLEDIALDPASKFIMAKASENSVALWELKTGKTIKTLSYERGCSAIACAISPSGKMTATGNNNDTLTLWNPDSGIERTLRGHSSSVLSVGFAKNEKLLASGSRDETVIIWDLQAGSESKRLRDFGGIVQFVGFANSDHVIATVVYSGDDPLNRSPAIVVKQVADDKTLAKFPGWKRPSISLDGKYLCAIAEDSCSLAVWNMISLEKVFGFRSPHGAKLAGACFKAPETLLVATQTKVGLEVRRLSTTLK